MLVSCHDKIVSACLAFDSYILFVKPKSRLSPPTSPTAPNNEESISKKLADAEERKKNLEQEKAKKLASQLEKISLAKEKKGKEEEKFSAEVMEKIESKQVHAEELKKKQMEEFKEKVCIGILTNNNIIKWVLHFRFLSIPLKLRRPRKSWNPPLRPLRLRHRPPWTRG